MEAWRLEFGVWCRDQCLGVGWRSALGSGWRSALGVVIGVGRRDQRWAGMWRLPLGMGFQHLGQIWMVSVAVAAT